MSYDSRVLAILTELIIAAFLWMAVSLHHIANALQRKKADGAP